MVPSWTFRLVVRLLSPTCPHSASSLVAPADETVSVLQLWLPHGPEHCRNWLDSRQVVGPGHCMTLGKSSSCTLNQKHKKSFISGCDHCLFLRRTCSMFKDIWPEPWFGGWELCLIHLAGGFPRRGEGWFILGSFLGDSGSQSPSAFSFVFSLFLFFLEDLPQFPGNFTPQNLCY